MNTLKEIWDFILSNEIATTISFLGFLLAIIVWLLSFFQSRKMAKLEAEQLQKIRAERYQELLEQIKLIQPKDASETLKEEVKTAEERIANPITADDLLLRAYAAQVDENYDLAMKYYNMVLQLAPDTAEAYYNMGIAYFKKCEYDKAIECYIKAIELKPDFAEAYYNIGNVYKEIGNYDRAIEHYKKATEFKPDFAEAYHNIGNLHKEEGNYNIAIANLTLAIEKQSQTIEKQSLTIENLQKEFVRSKKWYVILRDNAISGIIGAGIGYLLGLLLR